MASRLPILYAEDACLVLLAMRDKFISGCWPDGAFVPITPLFRGEYDDYGGLSDPQTPDPAWKLLDACDFRVETDGGLGPFEPRSPDDRESKLNELVALGRRGELYLVDDGTAKKPKTLQVVPVMVRGEIADMALAAVKDGREWDDVAEDVTLRTRLVGPIRNALRNAASCMGLREPDTAPLPVLKELFRFQKWMDLVRVSWSPTTGSGSQEDVNDESMSFHLAVKSIANRLSVRLDEYGDTASPRASGSTATALLMDSALQLARTVQDPTQDLTDLVEERAGKPIPLPGILLRVLEKQNATSLEAARVQRAAIRAIRNVRGQALARYALDAELLAMDVVQNAAYGDWSPTPALDALDGLAFALDAACNAPWDSIGLRRAAEPCLANLCTALRDAPQDLLDKAASLHAGLEALLA